MLTVCAWCKRQTKNGRAVGELLTGVAYASASHGMCEDCFDAYENSCLNSDLARSERVRSQNTKADPIVAAQPPRLVCK